MQLPERHLNLMWDLVRAGFSLPQAYGLLVAAELAVGSTLGKERLGATAYDALVDMLAEPVEQSEPAPKLEKCVHFDVGTRVIVNGQPGHEGQIVEKTNDGKWTIRLKGGATVTAASDELTLDTSADANGMIQGVTRVREKEHPRDEGIVLRPTLAHNGSFTSYVVLWKTGTYYNEELISRVEDIEIIS